MILTIIQPHNLIYDFWFENHSQVIAIIVVINFYKRMKKKKE